MKTSKSSLSVVDDIISRLSTIGINSNRLKNYKKNIVFSFSDGYMIAEIIYYYNPNIIDIKSFLDEGSEFARKANWDRLMKLLPKIGLRLSKDEVNAIINRQVEKELVANFIFLLTDKLNDMRKSLPSNNNTTISADSNKVNDNDKIPIKTNNNTSTNNIGNNNSSGKINTKIPSTSFSNNTLSTKTQSILGELERKKEVSRRTSLMSSQQLDDMYNRTITTAREESQKITAVIDEMQKKSEVIDAQFKSLRERNEEELIRVEKRLSVLELEVKAIDNNSKYFTEIPEEETSTSFHNELRPLSVFGFDVLSDEQQEEEADSNHVTTYTRAFSLENNAYYYINNDTDEVQWEKPNIEEKYIVDYE